MLTPGQRAEFETLGYTRIAACTAAAAAAMADAVWRELARVHSIARDDPGSWRLAHPSRLAGTAEQPFAPLDGGALPAALDALLGAGEWQVPRRWGAVLVSLPVARHAWTVPSGVWHADFPFALPIRPLPGVKVFALLADVVPRGGGTLVLSGSHRLVERFVVARSSAARADTRRMRLAFFDSHAWLRALVDARAGGDRVARFMHDSACIDGVALRVAELTGAAGEVVLAHPWLMHCRGPSGEAAPRLMRAHDVYRASLAPSAAQAARSSN